MSLDSFKYQKETQVIVPGSAAPVKVTMYGSEKGNKLNLSDMITDSGKKQLNDSVQTIGRVNTSFNVTNDDNQKKLANTKLFVMSLRELDEPKLMKELTQVINKLKAEAAGSSEKSSHIDNIMKMFVVPMEDPKRAKKLNLLK